MSWSAGQKMILMSMCLWWGLAARVDGGLTESAPPVLPPTAPVRAAVPAVELRPDFKKYFDAREVKGSFVLWDPTGNRFVRYNPDRCAERFLPASTFKVMSALMALESGIVQDENTGIPWDGTQYRISEWNQDHTLKSALSASAVWYFQELARRMGKDRIQRYLDEAGYGNRNISGPVDSFWLDGGLRISPEEQVDVLHRLYRDELPFSGRSMEIVRRILVLEEGPEYRLSGKTGTVQQSGRPIGWFVGALEKGGRLYCFALNIEGATVDEAFLKARVGITREILNDLGLLGVP